MTRRIFMSARMRSAMPGRCTLMTTLVPSRSSAPCTCAIDAEARGTSSKRCSAAARSPPSSFSSVEVTSANGNGRTRSRTRCISAT